ncbi:T9SS type A sorting domain-containing protein [Hymenobacter chitinivorans]|uniref:Putative delta-60 repeat protein/predicted secreted protein (Por secretion system target) n=1 Tax=Hymenobacter chitinivorans DSM 11115 TaxID=1121954 RepID=A0A2M9B4H5_9BACT|nr:T9SS type A sorting domain-containing protein [Hymenobacter chitinivorans]PJJ52837.1 putative delta-60 repeat protein/predicted secreted protein (Por secretion system target) [Hymenobacter chitinivorans DSM 11115]
MRPTLTCKLLAILLVSWLSNCFSAQAQSLDLTFKPTILKTPLAVGNLQAVNALAVQADGKILVGGGIDFVNGNLTGKLLRLNPDGTPDPAFNANGLGANGYVSAVLVQPDGKILVGGGFTTFNEQARSMVVRLNADGSLDNTFTFGSAASVRQIGSLALQPDGKILVGGGPSLQNTPPTGGLVRLNSNGSLDSSFSVAGTLVQGEMVWAIVVQADGKIVVGGTFTNLNGQNIASLARLTSSGAIDPTFYTANLNTTVGPVSTLAQQPDGKLLVGGSFTQLGGQPVSRIARLLPDGTYDSSFQPGTGANGTVRALYLEPSGSILITGSFTQVNGVSRGRVARLTATGSLDAGFATGAGVNNATNALAVLPTGQVLLAGGFTQYDGANYSGLVRLNMATGQAEAAFAPTIEARGTLSQVVPLPSGQLLVSGNFTQLNGQAVAGAANAVRRLNPDGSLDGNFTALATGALQEVQANGSFYVINGTTLRHYLADGTLDNTFTAQTFGSGLVILQGVTVLTNGQLFAYGIFTSYGSRTGLSGLVRLNADGSLDNTFVPASAPTDRRVLQVLTQPSGKLVVVADVVNTFVTTVTRLNADGSADNSFSVGSAAGSGASYQVLMQPDGKLLVSGTFTSFNGQAAPYGLVRLTTEGAPDPTYSGVTSYYVPRLVQPDGRLLALRDNTPSPGANAALVRLTADGSLDTGFSPVAVPHSIFTNDGIVTGIKLQPADSKILLYGSFRYVAGQVRIGLARLTNTTLATRNAVATQPLTVYPNPTHEAVTVQLPTALEARPATLLDLQGRPVRTWTVPAGQAATRLSLQAVPAGLYLLQVQDAGGLYQQKVVVTP